MLKITARIEESVLESNPDDIQGISASKSLDDNNKADKIA